MSADNGVCLTHRAPHTVAARLVGDTEARIKYALITCAPWVVLIGAAIAYYVVRKRRLRNGMAVSHTSLDGQGAAVPQAQGPVQGPVQAQAQAQAQAQPPSFSPQTPQAKVEMAPLARPSSDALAAAAIDVQVVPDPGPAIPDPDDTFAAPNGPTSV